MNILALGGSNHDFSACLITEGEIKYAIEDERLTRIKHSRKLGMKAYKCKAGEYCLQAAGLTTEDIDMVIGNDFLHPFYYTKFKDKIHLINHHLAHAASAFYPSPFEEAAILIADGCGSLNKDNQHETISFYEGKGQDIREIKKNFGKSEDETRFLVENSLGAFYGEITNAIGFGYRNEGKTMGLAPYGENKYYKDFSFFYTLNNKSEFIQTISQLNDMKEFIFNLLSAAKTEEEKFKIKTDIAHSGQKHLEKILIELANYLYTVKPSKNLCLAGGVFLNSVANYKILEETPFENIFIQPAAGDAGTSIGSALYALHALNNKPRKNNQFFSPYLGKIYTDQEIKNVLNEFKDKIHIKLPKDLNKEVAKHISDGKIIGWFQGGSEIGPRALGNRSILADATNYKMKDIINSRIKHRESFRPFAPIVLEEDQEEYFSTKHPSYYMLFVPEIHKHKQKKIPSVNHVDGTGRIQTVKKSINPKLHDLLLEFKKLTNIPVLLNTSFNDNGEPIIETPYDALNCFLNIDLDFLVIGDYLISK